MYMLFYQMSRMCREKGAVKHDDRLDCLAQGIKYYTDALSISAHDAVKERKAQEWQSMLQDYLDNPEASADHLVLGMNKDQRDEANRIDTGQSSIPTWV